MRISTRIRERCAGERDQRIAGESIHSRESCPNSKRENQRMSMRIDLGLDRERERREMKECGTESRREENDTVKE